jgi:NADPH:quinone reductase-like Zn-dependent oxidoreductase
MTNVQRTYPGGEAMTTMRAISHQRYGQPDVLELLTIDQPSPADDEVLIRVAAASLNPLDWHFMTGTPYVLRLVAGLRQPRETIRGADVAGTVVALGADVSGLVAGDRVMGGAQGSFAEWTLAKPTGLAVLPDDVSFADAAAMPVAGVTALQALRDHAQVQTGHRVLINGAAGGVGTFAVQLAVAMGAEVTGVCSTHNVEMVSGLGADRVVDYTTEDCFDGTQYDAIIDNVGNRSLGDCVRSLVKGGRYVMISGPKDNPWLDPFRRLIAGKIRFLRSGRTFHNFTARMPAEDLQELLRLVEAGQLRSVIDRTVSLEDVPEALHYLGTGHARAKVVIDVAGGA